MAARQFEMFQKPPPSRRGQLMHVCDAGDSGDGRKPLCQFRCARCGHRSDWLKIDTVTEAKRGLPCPECNKNG